MQSHTERLRKALEELVHLHLCEQEGMSSGQPTRSQWLEAVDNASAALSEGTTSEGQDGECKWSDKDVDQFTLWWHRDYRFYPGYGFLLKTDGHKSFIEVKYFTTKQLLDKFQSKTP